MFRSLWLSYTLVLGLSAVGHAATYWVSKTASPQIQHCINSATDPGNESSSFTIAQGLGCLGQGDTLIIKAGTYAERIASGTIPTGTAGARTTLRANTGDTVIIQPSGAGTIVSIIARNYITLDGLIMDGASLSSGQIMTIGDGASHIIIQNSTLRNKTADFSSSCVSTSLLTNPPTDIQFLRNHVHNCKNPGTRATDSSNAGYAHCIYIRASTMTIDGNIVHDCEGYGIASRSCNVAGGCVNTNSSIRNNVVYNCVGRGINVEGTGSTITHNLIYNNNAPLGEPDPGETIAVAGVLLNTGGPNNIKVYNNTIYNTAGWGIRISTGTGHIARNNILYNNSLGGITTTGSTTTQSNNLTTNPFFANIGTADFSLTAASTAHINQGFNVSLPFNSAPDIGAFETFIPTTNGAEVGNIDNQTVAITFTNNAFPPLLPATGCHTGFTVAGIASSPTVTSCTRSGQNTLLLGLSDVVVAGDTSPTWSYSGTTVTDSALGGWTKNQPLLAYSNQPILNNVAAGSTAEIAQTHFAFFQLYGAEASPTPLDYRPTVASIVDQAMTIPPTGAFRLRIKLAGSVADPAPINVRLYHQKNAGGYSAVQNTFVDGLRAYGSSRSASGIPTHGTTTTADVLTNDNGATTDATCVVVSDANSIPNVDLTASNEVECEWALELNDTVDQTHSFRVYTDTGVPMTTYTQTPTLVTREPFAASTQ